MTHKRSWLALGALLAAIVGGAVWASEPAKKPGDCCADKCCPKAKSDECSTATYDAAKVGARLDGKECCEGKCCTKEKGGGECCTKDDKGCCADGKCCGCCAKKEKEEKEAARPSTINVMLALPFHPFMPSMLADGSPYYAPAPPMPPPPAPPMQYTPVTQYPPAPTWNTSQCLGGMCTPPVGTTLAAAPVAGPWRLHAVTDKDGAHLEMDLNGGGENACASCDKMTLKIGNESLKVCVVEKQVQVVGSFVKATADAISRNPADGSITLEGHAKVKYQKNGQKADVSADRVLVGVADGRLEVKPATPLAYDGSSEQFNGNVMSPLDATAPARPGSPTAINGNTSPLDDATAPAPAPPAIPPAAGTDAQPVFRFWSGYFH